MTEQTPQPGVVSAGVYSALAAHSTDAASRWQSLYPDPGPVDIPEQIACANRYLRVQLSSLPYSTISLRECLLDRIELNDWLRLFSERIAPMLAEFKLPRADI